MKNEMSEFIKKAYEHGKIKDVSEAFDEFPPEEEWHQGKIENVIKESSVSSGNVYEIGNMAFYKRI